jgi:hypothetical protein
MQTPVADQGNVQLLRPFLLGLVNRLGLDIQLTSLLNDLNLYVVTG